MGVTIVLFHHVIDAFLFKKRIFIVFFYIITFKLNLNLHLYIYILLVLLAFFKWKKKFIYFLFFFSINATGKCCYKFKSYRGGMS